MSIDSNSTTNNIKYEYVTSGTLGQTVRRKINFKYDNVGVNMAMVGNKHDALENTTVHKKSYAEIVQSGGI